MADSVQEKREKGFFGEPVFHQARTKETLDPFYWTYDQFRTTVHGHLNADDEDFTYKTREMNLSNLLTRTHLNIPRQFTMLNYNIRIRSCNFSCKRDMLTL